MIDESNDDELADVNTLPESKKREKINQGKS